MTKVVHCKKEKFDVYIGRQAKRFHFGNPFSHLECSKALVKVETREQSIEFFDKWLDGEIYTDLEQERRFWILDHLGDLKDKIIGCWCKPLNCHGDSLAKRVDKI